MILVKRIVFIVLTVSSGIAFSQTEKGTFLLGGTFSYERSVIDYANGLLGNQNSRVFSMNPNISYFVIPKLAVGLTLPLSRSNFEVENTQFENKTTTNSYAFGPQLRYYFNFEKISVFTEISYAIGRSTTEGPFFSTDLGQVIDDKQITKIERFRLGLGLTYFISKSVGVELLTTYLTEDFDYDQEFVSDFENQSIRLELGLQVYFNRNVDQ